MKIKKYIIIIILLITNLVVIVPSFWLGAMFFSAILDEPNFYRTTRFNLPASCFFKSSNRWDVSDYFSPTSTPINVYHVDAESFEYIKQTCVKYGFPEFVRIGDIYEFCGVGSYDIDVTNNPGTQHSIKVDGSLRVGLFYDEKRCELTTARFRY